MMVIPRILNNEDVKELPENLTKYLNEYLKKESK